MCRPSCCPGAGWVSEGPQSKNRSATTGSWSMSPMRWPRQGPAEWASRRQIATITRLHPEPLDDLAARAHYAGNRCGSDRFWPCQRQWVLDREPLLPHDRTGDPSYLDAHLDSHLNRWIADDLSSLVIRLRRLLLNGLTGVRSTCCPGRVVFGVDSWRDGSSGVCPSFMCRQACEEGFLVQAPS